MAYTPYKAQRMQSPMAQAKTKKLLKSEHKDTQITGGNKNEEIVDIKDRIEFIEEDISNQDGKINPTQRADLATLDQKLRKLKNK